MRRLFWLGLGAALGVLIVRKLARTAESLTPTGISRSLSVSLSHLGDAVNAFADEVRVGMAEREEELMAALHAEGTDRDIVGTPGDAGAGDVAHGGQPAGAPAPHDRPTHLPKHETRR